jgi:hypothetical protein
MMDRQPEIVADVPQGWIKPAFSIPVLAGLAVVGGHLPSFSPQANLYSLAVGGGLIWLGLSPRVPRRPAPGRMPPGAIWWALPALLFGVFEAATFLLGSSDDFPTFSRLADPLLEDEMIRSVVYFGWLSAFWALVRR